MPLIDKPLRKDHPDRVTVTWAIGGKVRLRQPELWFSVPPDQAHRLSGRSDAAMLALLVPSMQVGEDLVVRGTVSPRLLASLNGPVQDLLLKVMPDLRRVRIEAEDTCAAPEQAGSDLLTGFSAGGDSLHTLLRPREPGEPRPTHLLNVNVGGHGEGAAADAIFRLRLARLGGAARELGLPLLALDSNLRRFHDRRTDFLATIIVRTAAAVLALQPGASGYEFSNAYHRNRQGVLLKGDISRIEDELLPLLSTESLAMRATGSDLTRIEKMLLVTAHPVAERWLDVCQKPRHAGRSTNCGRCLKCMRALLFLEISGRLDRFGEVFDLHLHRRLRWWNHAFFLKGIPDLRTEVEAFAAQRGFTFSPLGRLMANPGFYTLGNLVQRLLARLP